ncbi:MAG: helix-turn-helix domain-containing protein, partial [Pseudomonadota bacterium]|nr:helix-turn-helix domain-containing protein [Pseudomonadota bacterium]
GDGGLVFGVKVFAKLELGEAQAPPAFRRAHTGGEHQLEHCLLAQAIGDDLQPASFLNEQALQEIGGRRRSWAMQASKSSSKQATARVERRIARSCACCATPDGIEVGFVISRQDLAELTRATLYTVSRTLSAWESQGVIESGRQRIVVRNPQRLTEIAEDA